MLAVCVVRTRRDQKLKVRFGNISLLVLGGRNTIGQFLAAAQNKSILIGSHFYFKFGNTLNSGRRRCQNLHTHTNTIRVWIKLFAIPAYEPSLLCVQFKVTRRQSSRENREWAFFKLNLNGLQPSARKEAQPELNLSSSSLSLHACYILAFCFPKLVVVAPRTQCAAVFYPDYNGGALHMQRQRAIIR